MPLIFDDDGRDLGKIPDLMTERVGSTPASVCRTDDMPSGGSERLADIAPAAAADARAFHDRADRRVFGWTWAWTAAACREDESTRAASTNWRAWRLAAERAWLQVPRHERSDERSVRPASEAEPTRSPASRQDRLQRPAEVHPCQLQEYPLGDSDATSECERLHLEDVAIEFNSAPSAVIVRQHLLNQFATIFRDPSALHLPVSTRTRLISQRILLRFNVSVAYVVPDDEAGSVVEYVPGDRSVTNVHQVAPIRVGPMSAAAQGEQKDRGRHPNGHRASPRSNDTTTAIR